MPTLAEKWMQEGEERVRQMGFQRAFQIGYHAGYLAALTRVLTSKVGVLDLVSQARLEALAISDLQKLADKVLDLSTVDELQGWLATRS